MGIRLGQKSSPPVHVYREPVDSLFVALIAFAEAFHRGGYYRASTFVLIPTDIWIREVRYRRQEYGEAALLKATAPYGYLEYVCAAVAVESV